MEANSLTTELILTHPRQLIGKTKLDWTPQPGNYLDFENQTYTVLERHHHYQYQVNGYHLRKISLHVQKAPKPEEKTWLDGRWVIGDITCIYNAKSEILRCAVNPEGPCENCRFRKI